MQTRFAFGPAADHASREAPPPRRTSSAARPDPARAGRPRGEAGRDALLVLDIETVPDPRLMPPDWPADRFPKNAWHRIVAISFVAADILPGPEGDESYAITACRSGGDADWDEARLLDAFWRFFDRGRYRVVSWNGRCFDMPTILARSLMHGIAAPAWFQRGTKWDGYRHRHAADWHVDLMDAMSEHGAAARLTLEEAAAMVGLPGKLGEHGSEVAAMVAAGEIDRVRAYCETDCLNCFALYVRWAHLTGRADAASHDRAISALAEYLELARAERPHLGRFRDGWTALADGRAMVAPRVPAPAATDVAASEAPEGEG